MATPEQLGDLTRRLERLFYKKHKTVDTCANMIAEVPAFSGYTVHKAHREITLIAPSGETSTLLFGRLRFIVRHDWPGHEEGPSTFSAMPLHRTRWLDHKSVADLRGLTILPAQSGRDEGIEF